MSAVLLVDDDDSFRNAMVRILTGAGHAVRDLPSGRDVVKELAKSPVDVLVTDLIMPDVEGLETIRSVRRHHPDLPIIAISGGGRLTPASYLTMARGVGASDVLEKPFEPAQLVAMIGRLSEKRA
jgi:two-component system, chemotaxis family, chemotaxis protein CheY